ncbi:MAG: RDD family protein [Bacteroidia bacterium]|nr:RDD family protein [Bacteroidia bacterium]MDW8347057.1 RDD family protein [Bacteroidia bacterium]
MNTKPYANYQLGSRGLRFLAYIIDSIVLWIVIVTISRILSANAISSIDELILLKETSEPAVLEKILSLFRKILIYYFVTYVCVQWLYGFVCYPNLRGTLGHRIFNLRVIGSDGQILTGVKGGSRELLKSLPTIIYILVFLFSIASMERLIANIVRIEDLERISREANNNLNLAYNFFVIIIYALTFVIFFLWKIWLIFNKDKQNIYDLILKTYVVVDQDSVTRPQNSYLDKNDENPTSIT